MANPNSEAYYKEEVRSIFPNAYCRFMYGYFQIFSRDPRENNLMNLTEELRVLSALWFRPVDAWRQALEWSRDIVFEKLQGA